ncbi:MAG: helix-turn-helix domain-containing protein, partial [Bdellovibrionota bacterium]
MKPYRLWAKFLKTHRELHFRSAREFCAKLPVGISYPQYSRYESGDQLPPLEQALGLARLLKIPTAETLLEWSRAQVEDPQSRLELDQLPLA